MESAVRFFNLMQFYVRSTITPPERTHEIVKATIVMGSRASYNRLIVGLYCTFDFWQGAKLRNYDPKQ